MRKSSSLRQPQSDLFPLGTLPCRCQRPSSRNPSSPCMPVFMIHILPSATKIASPKQITQHGGHGRSSMYKYIEVQVVVIGNNRLVGSRGGLNLTRLFLIVRFQVQVTVVPRANENDGTFPSSPNSYFLAAS